MSTEYSISALIASLRAAVLSENFTLVCHSWKPARDCAALVADIGALRDEAIAEAGRLAWPQAIVDDIGKAYPERFASGLMASHAFALHLFRIAEDNWFSFLKAREASAWFKEPEYLSKQRELFLLKPVGLRPVLSGLTAAPELPLVVDLGEGTMHFLLVGLAD